MTKSKLQITKNNNETEEVAIKVENLSKVFKVPHERQSTIKGAAVNAWKRKSYEKFEALKGVSFEVKKGEFLGIIGRNGSGKSTLLKILAGIYVPDGGKVEINGKLSPFLELGVGFNPELTGRENLFLGGSILGLARNEIEEKFASIVAFAELEEFIDMKLKNYSSGMQVRLAFSLAINAHAEILLMDEVLAVGDSNFQAKCIEEFNKYREEGKTVVLVTHDTSTVQRYCDRAILLKSGVIKELGSSEDVVNKYVQMNMKDEINRFNKTLRKVAAASKNGKAEILNLKVIDREGEERQVYESGEAIKFIVKYEIYDKNLKEVNFAVGARTPEGVLVFGYTTEAAGYKPSSKIGVNEIILTIPELNVLKGEYNINVMITGKDMINQIDFKPKLSSIKVFNTEKRKGLEGISYSEHEWAN